MANLLSAEDSGFEGGTTGTWVAGGGTTMTATTDFANPGTYALKRVGSASSAHTPTGLSGILIVGSSSYTFSGNYGSENVNSNPDHTIYWYDSGGSACSHASDSWNDTESNGWNSFSHSVTSPSDAIYAAIEVSNPGQGTASGEAQLDDLLVFDGPAGSLGVTIIPGVLNLVITGFAPTVTASDNKLIIPDPLNLVITGYAGNVQIGANFVIIPPKLSLVITGFVPTLLISTNNPLIVPGKLSLVITGYAPTVFISPPILSVTIGGNDQTRKVIFGSATLKLNTFDFALLDPAIVPALGDIVVLTTPTWTGTIVSIGTSDPVERVTGHQVVTISATNTDTAGASAGPWGLSDAPDNNTTYGYYGLSVKQTQNLDGTVLTAGKCGIYATGLWPLMTFNLTSSNQGFAAQEFSVTNSTVTWTGQGDTPVYSIEFGDPIVTMSVWRNSAAAGILPIDTTKITDDAVTTPKLAAGSVTADKLTANLILASKIIAGSGTQRVEMDGGGIVGYDASNNIVFSMKDDGSPIQINAELVASILSVTGSAVFQGTDNELALGAVLQLNSSQSDPSINPSIAGTWDGTAMPIDATYDVSASTYDRLGLQYDSVGGSGGATPSFWTVTNKANGTSEYALELSASTLSVNRNIVAGGANSLPLGVARLGSYVYVLTKDTGTGGGVAGNLGATGAATFSYDFSGVNTDNQIFMGPYTMPSHSTITGLSVNMGAHSAPTTAQLVLWNGAGSVAGHSGSFTAAVGHSQHTYGMTAAVDAPAGSTWFIGFWRQPGGSGEWGVTSSGNFKIRNTASGAPASISGYVNGSAPYALGNMQAFAQYTTVVATTKYTVKRYLQNTLVLDSTYTAVSFPTTVTNPQLTTDGSNLFIVDKTSAGTVQWNKYDAAMAKVGSTIDTGYGFTGTVTSAYAGNADFGAARLAIGMSTTYGIQTFTTAGAVQANEAFSSPGAYANGITYDGTRFWSMPVTSSLVNLTKHSLWTWTTASSIYWAGYSWYDSNATGGTHETMVGPRSSITLSRRQQLVITAQVAVSAGGTNDPNNIRFYLKPNATDPAATAFWLQATQSGATYTAITYTGSGTADPASNNFPTGTASILQSETGGFSVKGDGSLVLASRPAFVASDKYLVVDSSGNVHKSALGPAS